MVWVALAALGVPLWLIAGAISVLVMRNRALRRRPGNFAVRVRRPDAKRWSRGNGLWVHDVFTYRGSPAAWKEELVWVLGAQSAPATGQVAHRLRRLEEPQVTTLTTSDGATFQVGTSKADSLLLPRQLFRPPTPVPTHNGTSNVGPNHSYLQPGQATAR